MWLTIRSRLSRSFDNLALRLLPTFHFGRRNLELTLGLRLHHQFPLHHQQSPQDDIIDHQI
eukprot:5606912-Amphidinium_carterae.2